jgi:hypothetical protein
MVEIDDERRLRVFMEKYDNSKPMGKNESNISQAYGR